MICYDLLTRMAQRRYKNSEADNLFDDLVKLSSVLPWWLTLTTALLLFFLVPYGSPADIQLNEPSDAIWVMLGIFIKALFKFLIPMGLVFGTVINIFTQFKSHSLFKSIQKKGARETVQELKWQDFEFLLSEWFKKQGYTTELTGGGGADGGVDIKLYKDGQLYLVQCKHYKTWKVSVQVVRELFGVMAAEKAVGGYVVTSGKYTQDAQAFAEGKNIELIDGPKLEAILDSSELTSDSVTEDSSELCPKCGNPLTERKGKYGKFLGCTTYPKCTFTKPIK